MKKLGKRSSLESGTFFAYACNCNCGSVPCGTATTAMTTRIRSQLVHTHYPMLQKCN